MGTGPQVREAQAPKLSPTSSGGLAGIQTLHSYRICWPV